MSRFWMFWHRSIGVGGTLISETLPTNWALPLAWPESGKYTVLAFDDLEADIRQPELLKSYDGRGEHVQLDEGSRTEYRCEARDRLRRSIDETIDLFLSQTAEVRGVFRSGQNLAN